MIGKLPEHELQTYITNINTIKSAPNSLFDSTVAQKYAATLKDVEASQAALLLSSQGLSNAQIAETLAVNESNVAKNYQAMADAGLLSNKKKLTVAEIQENLQTVLGAEADTSEAMASLGLSGAIEGQKKKTVKLTAAKIQEMVATGKLTEAQAQELAMRTGVILSMEKQAASILPKWIATLRASTKVIWEQVAATAKWLVTTSEGWVILTIGAFAIAALAAKKYNEHLEEIKRKTREAAAEAKSEIDSIKSDFDTLASDTDKVKRRYAELAQQVENLGKVNQSRGKLSTEDYEEFLGLSNQLVKLFPQLRAGCDDNGNAILNLSGNVDTIVGSLENLVSVQQKLANQEILKNMPDVWAGYMLDINEYKESLSDMEEKSKAAVELISRIGSEKTLSLSIESDKSYENVLNHAIMEALTRLGYGKPSNSWNKMYDLTVHTTGSGRDMRVHGSTVDWDFSSLDDSQFEQFKNELGVLSQEYEDVVMFTKSKIDCADSDMASYINAWLTGEWNYNKLDSNIQNAAKILLFDGDWISLIPDTVDSTKWDEVSNWIQQEFLFQLQKVQDNEEISNALSEVFSNAELTPEAKASYIKQIQDYFGEESMVTILLQPQLEATEDLQKQYDDAVSKFGENEKNTLVTFFKEKSINDSSEIDYWSKITANAKSAEEAVKMYNESKRNEIPISFSDIFSLKSADDTLTNLGKLSESIDTIQNTYKTLNDAIDEYNQNGVFSIDTLQSVTALGDDWLDYLVDEEGNLTLDKEALERLTCARLNDMRVQTINNVIDNVSKIKDDAKANEYLASTNYALADSYETLTMAKLKDAEAEMEKAVTSGELSKENMDEALKKAAADIDKINNLFDNTNIAEDSIMGGSSSGLGSATSEFSETVDFFERRITVLDDALSHLKSTMDNVSGSFGKNNLLDAELGITEEKFHNYSDALSMYTQKANEAFAKIPADIAAKVKDGAVALNDFVGDNNKDVVEAIKDYESWADKVSDCQQNLAELKKEIRQLELEKFNNIISDFTNRFDLRENSKNLISKQIDLLSEAGELIGESFYSKQIEQSQKQLKLLEDEKGKLIGQMTDAMASGRIQKGTDEWLKMVNALSDVDGNILDCKKSIEEFDNSILALHTEVFERTQAAFGNLSGEISNLIGFMEDSDVGSPDGSWTKEGLTQLGLYAQQYELAKYQVSQYAEEIEKLNADYLNGRYSATEYADKLADLSSAQWDAVNAAESAKDAIVDLNKARVDIAVNAIQEQINAYKELTDAQIKALQAEKDLHDYEKSLAEKEKDIAKLRKQIAAMQNDNSASTVAKRKQLEEQLAEALADLEETQYQHSIEAQEEALNQQYEDYEELRNKEMEALEDSLKDEEKLISDSLNAVKRNTETISNQIVQIARDHGVKVSNEIVNAWKSGENAIASYGEVLTAGTSAFIGQIQSVEAQIYRLQDDADVTAATLSNLFATKADNLVNELTESYYAEANLYNMTQALQNSLTATLEGGYDVSGIVNSLREIRNEIDETIKKLGDIPEEPAKLPKPKNSSNGIGIFSSDYSSGDIGNNRDVSPDIVPIAYDDGSDGEIKKKTGGVGAGDNRFAVTFHPYAYGSPNIPQDQLAVTNEDGQEIIYHAKDNSLLTRLSAGDKVFDNASVNRLWEISHGNLPANISNLQSYLQQPIPFAVPSVVSSVNLPDRTNANFSRDVNIHYDSLVTVHGDVNDTDHFIKQVTKIADQQITKSWKQFNDEFKY